MNINEIGVPQRGKHRSLHAGSFSENKRVNNKRFIGHIKPSQSHHSLLILPPPFLPSVPFTRAEKAERADDWRKASGRWQGIERWKRDSELGIVRLQLLVVFLSFFSLPSWKSALGRGRERDQLTMSPFPLVGLLVKHSWWRKVHDLPSTMTPKGTSEPGGSAQVLVLPARTSSEWEDEMHAEM